MNGFQATWFDGLDARAHPVVIERIAPDALRIRDIAGGPDRIVPLRDCRIVPPLGRTRRVIRLPDGGRCETDDRDAVAELEAAIGRRGLQRLLHRFEARWTGVVAGLLVLAVGAALLLQFGIPWLADLATRALPASFVERISEQALERMDDGAMRRTTLDLDQVLRAHQVFRRTLADMEPGTDCRLELRKGGYVGPNAFALPSGVIVVTDELIDLIRTDDEMAGVLAHELSHVRHRHGLRRLFQHEGIGLLVAAVAGNAASVSSIASELPRLLMGSAYSREFEAEADTDAGRWMVARDLGTEPLQSLLVRMDHYRPPATSPELLSTHPDLAFRLSHLREIQAGSRR